MIAFYNFLAGKETLLHKGKYELPKEIFKTIYLKLRKVSNSLSCQNLQSSIKPLASLSPIKKKYTEIPREHIHRIGGGLISASSQVSE